MILITTAGKVGAEAARLLAEQQIPARVLARDPASAKALELAGKGMDVVAGDLRSSSSVDAAMRGIETVLLVSPAVPEQEIGVISAAVRAGARHVVKITNKAAPDSPIARQRGQAQIEAALADSGLGHTLVRSNAFMQNLLMLAPAIAASGGFGSSAGDGRIGMVDARDVAEVASRIAASPAEHVGKTYWPTGPAALSYPDAAAILTDVLGRPITFQKRTVDEDMRAMIAAGLPPAVAEDNARALSLFAQGDADYVTDDVPTLLGRPACSFRQFAADHAQGFTGFVGTR
jgi:uncharacterized protein YbjT (DUF2867 family)